MRACNRCGFLNPDKAEFCMKCRLDMKGEGGGESVRLVGNALSGSAVGKGPVDETTPQEVPLGDGGFDEPPSWAHKPDIAAPAPDLDDTFAGRGLDVGGYQVGGHHEVPHQQGPAVSDAFAIMTSSSALAGSEDIGQSRKRGKKKGGPRAKKQKAERPTQDLTPGGIVGLPPDLGGASIQFGLQEDDYRPPAPASPSVQRQGIPPGQVRQTPSFGQPVQKQAPGRAQEATPTRGTWPQPAPAPPAASSPPPPLAPLGGQGAAPPARRPVPRQAAPIAGPRPPRERKTRPPIAMPDLAFLKRAGDLLKPRVIVGFFGALLVLFAVIYLLTGGSYFSSDARGLLEASHRAMRGAGSYHLQADILMNTEKAGAINTAVSVDVVKDRELKAAYAEAAYHPTLEFVTVSGKTYKKTAAAAWEPSSEPFDPDFTSSALFASASGSRVIDKQAIDGVECDHIAYESGPDFARSFFPGVETTEATRVDVEIWVDPQQKYIRHIRLDARNLETTKLGQFDCHIEAALTGFGTPMEIKPPM